MSFINQQAIVSSAWAVLAVQRFRTAYQDRLESEDGLTTLEWALLVAGIAAMAITLVAVVRSNVDDTLDSIPTNVNITTGDG